ncbi:COR domain-containing protein [Streptomyces sp. 142MFCol3.1]|uniref:leucine-rich repeat domain-containing protein n=1 Tax=Streptomyces sp. 142MFCol3.1 TaxID=1172179 RepID=UPI001F2CABCB|nr:COR domain-containing protein [Streptomyces sp. 142MFCol3.1]
MRLENLPEWIGQLTKLATLNLNGTRSKVLPEWISQLANLNTLELSFSSVEILPDWIDQLTNLKTLDLSGTNLVDLPDALGNLVSLNELDLSFTHTELPANLGGLTNLTRLDLTFSRMTALPDWISQLTKLTTLNLLGSSIETLPEWIGELTNLTNLNASTSDLELLPDSMRNLVKLTSLNLSIKDSSALPEWISQLSDLTTLALTVRESGTLPDWLGQLTNLHSLHLGMQGMAAPPNWISQLTNLESLSLVGGELAVIPDWIGRLAKLKILGLAYNELESIPESIGQLTKLRSLDLSNNNFSTFPEVIKQLPMLTSLDLEANDLAELPNWLGELTRLKTLRLGHNKGIGESVKYIDKLTSLQSIDLSGCGLAHLPESLRNHASLTSLRLNGNKQLEVLPSWIGQLGDLRQLDLMNCGLRSLPAEIGELKQLTNLDLDGNCLTSLPDSLGQSASLKMLDLRNNEIGTIPESIADLKRLQSLHLHNNKLTLLPPKLGTLKQLATVVVENNPLPPEVLAADEEGTEELLNFIHLLHSEGELIREAKLVLVGEGAVGKSSLLAALRGEEWIEDRNTTHGIEIRPVEVTHEQSRIVLNSWDFGGQKIYRPTHQLFFTEPAVYLVVWKPREGPELGLVDEWISLIRHRAGSSARVHVVATHGGPGQRYAHIDEAALRDRYGDMIVAFHHVDSKSSPAGGISELKSAIAATAAGLPHVTRWYPGTWRSLRETLENHPAAYLRYSEYQEIAARNGLSPTSARSLAKNAHALGHWIYYADDPNLAELIILKADWLSVAIGLVLEDGPTIANEGLLPHRRLSEIWDDPNRDATHRYPHPLQQVFLRLMERFEISYRVPELTGGEPLSLVAQLLPSERPNLSAEWDGYRPNDSELVQICNIQEREGRRAVQPYGLMYRLIVLFHRHSLGRGDITQALHWAGGMVLQDRYGARALIVLGDEGLTIRVRGLNPQAFLDHLIQEVREYVEGFWRGLNTRVLIPCRAVCQFGDSGHGLFDLDKLYRRLEAGKREYTCTDPSCDDDVKVEALLRGLGRRKAPETQLEHVVREAVSNALDSHVTRLLTAQDAGARQVLARIDELDDNTKEAFSRAEDQLANLLRSLDDDAADGPRLFSLEMLDRSVWRPGVTKRRMKLTLWCEHSRLPVHVLEPDRSEAGVYFIDVPREWWVKAAPAIKVTSLLLKTILPVSLAAIEFDLNDQQWDAVKEQLALSKEILGASAEAAEALEAEADGSLDADTGPAPTRAEGGLLRMLHASLREQDVTFADLRRVRDAQGRFLWVHQRFVSEYQPPLPVIPSGREN